MDDPTTQPDATQCQTIDFTKRAPCRHGRTDCDQCQIVRTETDLFQVGADLAYVRQDGRVLEGLLVRFDAKDDPEQEEIWVAVQILDSFQGQKADQLAMLQAIRAIRRFDEQIQFAMAAAQDLERTAKEGQQLAGLARFAREDAPGE